MGIRRRDEGQARVGAASRNQPTSVLYCEPVSNIASKNAECPTCGLTHAPGELFVVVGVEARHMLVVVDTCELEAAFAAAHAAPQPPGALAYHATTRLDHVLEHGLDPALAGSKCKHVCLAETAEIAAAVTKVGSVVVEVDVNGLDLFFELREARHHDTVIGPERLSVLDPQPAPIATGWSDPGWRWNHSDCIARHGHPLSRRLLNAADDECRRRWPWDGYDDRRFLSVLAELAAAA